MRLILTGVFVIATYLVAQNSASAQDIPNIQGEWFCAVVCKCQPKVQNPYITQKVIALVLHNECNDQTNATLSNGTIVLGDPISGPPWNSGYGHVQSGPTPAYHKIVWDNGTVWTLPPVYHLKPSTRRPRWNK